MKFKGTEILDLLEKHSVPRSFGPEPRDKLGACLLLFPTNTSSMTQMAEELHAHLVGLQVDGELTPDFEVIVVEYDTPLYKAEQATEA